MLAYRGFMYTHIIDRHHNLYFPKQGNFNLILDFLLYVSFCCYQPITSQITFQVEATDPASGALYYYNKTTGKTQWEKPAKTSSVTPLQSPLSLAEDWVEALDETTGMPNMFYTGSSF